LKQKKYLLMFVVIFLSPLLVFASSQSFFSGATTSVDERINFAAAENGGVVVASSSKSEDFPVSAIIDGDRKGIGWGSGGGWADGTPGTFPDSVEIVLNSSVAIDEIDVITIQDTWWSPSEPTESLSFFNNGVTSFEVEYFDGLNWVAIPGGVVTGNNKVWRKFTFAPIVTSKIRVICNAAKSQNSILIEVEAYGVPAPPGPLPTPTPIFDDLAGALAQRDIFLDASNNVGFGVQNPIFNDDGTTGAFVGNWVAIDGKQSGAAAYLGVGGHVPKLHERVGSLNFYNSAMSGPDYRTATIFSFNGSTLGTGTLEFSTSPNFTGPVRRMAIAPTGEIGINHAPGIGTMLQVMGRTADATTHALGVLNGADRPLLTVRNDGQVSVGQPGQGIVLRSPNGLICRKLTIDDSGNLVVANMPSCP
jgi:hypothetical protein